MEGKKKGRKKASYCYVKTNDAATESTASNNREKEREDSREREREEIEEEIGN